MILIYSKQKTSLMQSSKLDGNLLTVGNLNNLLPTCAYPEGRTGGPDPPPHPLKNHKNKGFLSNTGPDSLKNHKTTKPAFNVGSSSASQQNTWCFAGGPMMARL